MCGDSHLPPAPSRGDAMAAIRFFEPSTTSGSSSSSFILRFSNPISEEMATEITYETIPFSSLYEASEQEESRVGYDCMEMNIHKYGYVSSDDESEDDPRNPVVYTMALKGRRLNCVDRLSLDVGGDGVIGRGVSLLDRDGRKIGVGIIGRL